MQAFASTRYAAAIFLVAAAGHAQVTATPTFPQKPSAAIPSTPPTSAQRMESTPQKQTPAQKQPRRADITFTDDQISVIADNSSLNQILRQIGRETGIRITGGVADERVFGSYGPAPVSDVLAKLIEGTGSNMLLVPGSFAGGGELILTPRHGGPTPPNPNAPGFDDDTSDNDSDAPSPRRQPGAPVGVTLFGTLPQGQPPASQAPQPAPQTDPNAVAPGTATTTDTPGQQSPNGVKTPQEIYQQLQQLRQQQQQNQPQPQ